MSKEYEEIALAKAEDVLDENNEFMFKVHNACNRWSDSEVELAQGRTNFQIEKFIIHDNFTIPTAFKAALINRKSVAEGLLSSVIEAKRAAREFHYKWEGKDKTKPMWWGPGSNQILSWYDLDEFNFHRMLEGLNQGYKAIVDELEFFDKIIERLIELNGGKPITKEQFEQDQPVYWQRRLSNQSLDDLLQTKTGVNAGNIRSMRRASAPTVLEDDLNRTKGTFGDPERPLEFLNTLQEHVAEGIEEITGLVNLLKATEEKKQFSSSDDENKTFRSLFNDELKTNS